jgi:S-adenosyl methyltransferase
VSKVAGFDASKPNVARVYDYWLGGKENFAADRQLAEEITRLNPDAPGMARDNRAFITRAVTWAAGQGIAQFIDIGAGLPTHPAVHETARALQPDARIAYVDNDPVVLVHAAALLKAPGVVTVNADLRDPAAVLASPELGQLIDLREPACVLLASVLHFFAADQAREITAGFTRPLAAGSIVVISASDATPELNAKVPAYTAAQLWNHGKDTFRSFFDHAGLELIDPPGVTTARSWRAGMPDPMLPVGGAWMDAAAGRKPA